MPLDNKGTVRIYTDGACSGNPGPGGYGIIMKYKNKEKKITESFHKTTNNRMELMAVIKGLEAIKGNGYNIEIYSDSRYVVDAIKKGWLQNWVKKNFEKKKNKDLWMQFYNYTQNTKNKLKFIWIKGHASHPENEQCDQMAVAGAKHPQLLDQGYEDLQKVN